MNQVNFMGRLVADPEIRFSTGENATCIANFRIAVDKRFKNKNDADAPTADFFRITAFGKLGEFVQNYLHKGTKIVMTGRIENANYTDKDGNKVFRDQIVAENIEFAESKKAAEANGMSTSNPPAETEFVPIIGGVEGDLPWN